MLVFLQLLDGLTLSNGLAVNGDEFLSMWLGNTTANPSYYFDSRETRQSHGSRIPGKFDLKINWPIDRFADRAAILTSIVSNSYYGMLKGQIHINLPPEYPIMSFETIEIKMPPYLQNDL